MAEPGAVAGVERHGRPRDPENDAAILDAALDLLIERGAAGTSIEAVAQRAGVAKLTVYRRWRAKEDLLMAALERARNPDMEAAPAGQSIDEVVASIAELLSRPRFRALMA
jgi:AcrR family transcriptional regulator